MLNYGIVGCGMMGREHIRNISLLPNARIAGIFEPNKEMCRLAKSIAPEAIFFESLKDLITKTALDCIVIATPNFCHIDDLHEIGENIEVPILLEKPVVTKIEDIKKITYFDKNYSAPIWVAMEYRYMPPLQEFIRKADTITGGVRMLSIREHRYPFLKKVDNWNRFNEFSGGTFVEKCCHFFDLMRLINSSNPTQIMAIGSQACNHLDESYDGVTPNIWDHGYVIVTFENGTSAMLELCMFADISTYQEEISAVGEMGKIECKLIGPKRFWKNENESQPDSKIIISDRKKKIITEESIPIDSNLLEVGDHNGSTFYQHEKFQKVVAEGKEVEVGVEEGVWAVRMGLAAQLSAIEKRAVKLSEI